jgi:hypothetical protein
VNRDRIIVVGVIVIGDVFVVGAIHRYTIATYSVSSFQDPPLSLGELHAVYDDRLAIRPSHDCLPLHLDMMVSRYD